MGIWVLLPGLGSAGAVALLGAAGPVYPGTLEPRPWDGLRRRLRPRARGSKSAGAGPVVRGSTPDSCSGVAQMSGCVEVRRSVTEPSAWVVVCTEPAPP